MENKVIINLDEYIFMKEQLKSFEKQLDMIRPFITKNYKYQSSMMFYENDKNVVCLSVPEKQLEEFINELAGTEGIPVDIIKDCLG